MQVCKNFRYAGMQVGMYVRPSVRTYVCMNLHMCIYLYCIILYCKVWHSIVQNRISISSTTMSMSMSMSISIRIFFD